MEDWIDIHDRFPKDGDIVSLPDIKGKYEVHGVGLYNKGRLAIPICLVETYMLHEEGQENNGREGH